VASQISHTIDICDETLRRHAELLRNALDDVRAMTATLTGYLMTAAEHPTEIYKVGLASVRYLLAVGDLLIGWRLLAQADVAHAALATAPTKDQAFYQGKIATAGFFAKNMLPNLTALRGIIEDIDDDIMALPEAAF
jgi:aryl carrier-like protein